MFLGGPASRYLGRDPSPLYLWLSSEGGALSKYSDANLDYVYQITLYLFHARLTGRRHVVPGIAR